MDLRQVFMRLHQGEYGRANWAALLVAALSFIFTMIAGLVVYLMKTTPDICRIPKLPSGFI